MNNKDNNQNNNKRRPTRVELYDTPKPGEEKKKRSFFNRKPKQPTSNHKHKTVSPNKKKNPYGISRRMFKVILGCLLVVLIATIVIFLVKQQDPVNVDSNDTTVSTSTSSRKKHKKSSSSSHKHRSNSNDSDDNDTQDTYSISTPSRSNSTPQTIQLTNNQLLTLPQLHNKTNHRRKNTTIKATANNNLLHNQQVAILGHSLIKVRKVLAPSQTHNQFNLTLKIININLE